MDEVAMSMVQVCCYILYHFLAKHLPATEAPYSFGAREIRGFLVKRLFRRCGYGINVQAKAEFGSGSGIEIGDYSGIGLRCVVGEVTIGNYVMMAPDCVLISRNHTFDDVAVPMCHQGYQPSRRIIIEDDVWLGTRVIVLPGVRIGKGAI